MQYELFAAYLANPSETLRTLGLIPLKKKSFHEQPGLSYHCFLVDLGESFPYVVGRYCTVT